MSRIPSVSASQPPIHTPGSNISTSSHFNPISNKNGPDEKYQVNEDLLYEHDFPGETYISAHLQRLQHGLFTDPNLHTKHPLHVTFAAITFTLHPSLSIDHRFEAATITIQARSENGERIRFLKFAPHLAYGRISSESLKWNFKLGASLGVSQGPAKATVDSSISKEKEKVMGTMMKIQGSTRSTFSHDHLALKKRHPDTLLHWSLEENGQQEDGLPREFTFVFLVERPNSHPLSKLSTVPMKRKFTDNRSDTTGSLSHIDTESRINIKMHKLKREISRLLKTGKHGLKHGVKIFEAEIGRDEVEEMKYEDLRGDDEKERGMGKPEWEDIFGPVEFEICVVPKISGTLRNLTVTPQMEKSVVAGEVGQTFPTEGSDDSVGKEEHPQVMVGGLYNFAKMNGVFEDLVSLPGNSVTSKEPWIGDEKPAGGK